MDINIQSWTKRLARFWIFPLWCCQGREAIPHLLICHFRKDWLKISQPRTGLTVQRCNKIILNMTISSYNFFIAGTLCNHICHFPWATIIYCSIGRRGIGFWQREGGKDFPFCCLADGNSWWYEWLCCGFMSQSFRENFHSSSSYLIWHVHPMVWKTPTNLSLGVRRNVSPPLLLLI